MKCESHVMRLIAAILTLLWSLTIASASSLITTVGVGDAGSIAVEAFGITFTTSTQTSTDNTTTSFTTQSVGTDVAGTNVRYTIVAATGFTGGGGGTETTVASMTICGVSATSVVATGAVFFPSAIFLADTTGLGTSCTIAVTYGASVRNNGIGVYRMVNPTSSTATASTSATTASSSVVTLSINVNSGGAAVAVTGDENGTSAATHTWAGPTETYDATMEGRATHSGASGGSSGTPLTITATASIAQTAGRVSGCAASWAP